jgi:hypothetical protein
MDFISSVAAPLYRRNLHHCRSGEIQRQFFCQYSAFRRLSRGSPAAPSVNRYFAGCIGVIGRSHHYAPLRWAAPFRRKEHPFPLIAAAHGGDHVFNSAVFTLFSSQHDDSPPNAISAGHRTYRQ